MLNQWDFAAILVVGLVVSNISTNWLKVMVLKMQMEKEWQNTEK